MAHKGSKNIVNDTQKSNRIQLSPRTEKQKEYLNALQNSSQVFAIGPAGSGKTYIPTMLATQMYLRGKIKKIILSRPAVEVGESHGFLPGDLHRKLAPWVLPITELIEEAVGKEKFITMMRAGDIEVAPFAYMRGRTFENAFVILDEAQNTTPKQMEMFLTRIGEGSRMVISGDLRQSDIGKNSGLAVAIDLIKRYKIPAEIIEFTSRDVVRSEMCRQWVEAFEKGA